MGLVHVSVSLLLNGLLYHDTTRDQKKACVLLKRVCVLIKSVRVLLKSVCDLLKSVFY